MRLSCLRNCQWAGPLGKYRASDAGEYEACENRNREDIFLDLLMPGMIGKPEDNVLYFVVDPVTCLEGIGLRVRGKIVQVGLQQPERLH